MRHGTEKKNAASHPAKQPATAHVATRQAPAGLRRHGNRPAPSAPKPPSGGHFLWGRHAVLAALANPERRIAALYATRGPRAVEGAVAALPASRRAELPHSERERRRLDALHPADGDKAVHQGMLAAVWPLDPWIWKTALPGSAMARSAAAASRPAVRPAQCRRHHAQRAGARRAGDHHHPPQRAGRIRRAGPRSGGRSGTYSDDPRGQLGARHRTAEEADIEIAGLAADGERDVGSLLEVERLGIVMGRVLGRNGPPPSHPPSLRQAGADQYFRGQRKPQCVDCRRHRALCGAQGLTAADQQGGTD